MKSIARQLQIIKRGVVEILPSEETLVGRLNLAYKEGRPLRIKAGFDPTAPDIHLGHTVLLRKLRHFQDLGHKIVFLIGDYTALIGDPSGQTQTRQILTPEEVEDNLKTYLNQVSKILRNEPALFEVRRNSEWFGSFKKGAEYQKGQMDLGSFLIMTSKYTVARILERDDFSKRLAGKKALTVLEILYPLLQGYDSVVLEADIELGGTDQKFNLLVGRDLQREYGQNPQVVMTLPLLVGLDGVRKMSKSYGNYIAITDSPKEQFGKIMSISDETMFEYYRLLTDTPIEEDGMTEVEKKVRAGVLHPKKAKSDLAFEIVKTYHTEEKALKARVEFERIFKHKHYPEDMPLVKVSQNRLPLLEILLKTGLCKSKSEGRRLITQGGIKVDGHKVTDLDKVIDITRPLIIQAGKRRFVKIAI